LLPRNRRVGGLRQRHGVVAVADPPLARVTVEAREQPRIGAERDAARFAGLELDPLEAEQAHARLAGSVREVQLRNVGAPALPRVRHGTARGERVAALYVEVAVVEGRVAQAVTERVQRFLSRAGEPAIADFRALVVLDGDRRAPRCAEAGQLGPR